MSASTTQALAVSWAMFRLLALDCECHFKPALVLYPRRALVAGPRDGDSARRTPSALTPTDAFGALCN